MAFFSNIFIAHIKIDEICSVAWHEKSIATPGVWVFDISCDTFRGEELIIQTKAETDLCQKTKNTSIESGKNPEKVKRPFDWRLMEGIINLH